MWYRLKYLKSAAGLAFLLFVLLQMAPAAAGEARISVLMSYDAAQYEETLEGFRGYMLERRPDTAIEIYPLKGRKAEAEKALKRCMKDRPSVILALGSLAADAVVGEKPGIPAVAGLILHGDEVEEAPNAASVCLDFPLETQFKWIRHLNPDWKTVGVLYNPRENESKIRQAARVGRKFGFVLNARRVASPRDIPRALKELSKTADVLWGIHDSVVVTPQTAQRLLLFSYRQRIPFVGLSAAWVKAGALFSLEWDYADIGKQMGEMAVKIINGIQADSFPHTAPRKVKLAVNLRTAERMKLKIPKDMLGNDTRIFR